MRIVINVKKLQAEIDVALKDYDKEYEKLLTLYQKKLRKYLVYVTKEINKIAFSKKPSQLKQPPFTPSWQRNHFIQVLEALKAHKNEDVEMDDREYNEIKNGIRRLRDDIRTARGSLNALSY